jgi:uncharacterized protein YndB with AHSA1/START domain
MQADKPRRHNWPAASNSVLKGRIEEPRFPKNQYRYVWRRESNGKEMGMGGVYCEIVPQERLVCTELLDEAWYPGESLITTTLVEQGGRTTMTSTMLYVSQEVRDGVLKSGMESGVAVSYDRLAELLASLWA